MSFFLMVCMLCVSIAAACACAAEAAPATDMKGGGIFARENLVAWCIVPFDAKKRGPKERVEMLARLGLKRVAYDWREEHVASWDEELQLYKQHGIELVGFWAGGKPDQILALLKRHEIKTQLWVMSDGKGADQREKVESASKNIEPLARQAADAGCTIGLYNHGGWFGEPENQIEIIELLKTRGVANVGIVYNLHHAHHRVKDLADILMKMKPYLYCFDLNGMKQGTKILPIGKGDDDLAILKLVKDSGYRGPIGILNHRAEVDAEEGLKQNISGLKTLLPQMGETDALKSYD